MDLSKWNFFFNVYYFRQATFFWQNPTHWKYYRCKKKDANFSPLCSTYIFFSSLFFFFFQYSCSFIRMKFEYISFSTLLKQYRLFIFHLSRYKNLIHIISFFFSLSHFIMRWKETRGSLMPNWTLILRFSIFQKSSIFHLVQFD